MEVRDESDYSGGRLCHTIVSVDREYAESAVKGRQQEHTGPYT